MLPHQKLGSRTYKVCKITQIDYGILWKFKNIQLIYHNAPRNSVQCIKLLKWYTVNQLFMNLVWYGKNSNISDYAVKYQFPRWVAVYHIIICSGGRRKSNCVTEVEKIKAKREQRRAQQQAIREHVEETCDTSNPNWEFLQMIRYVHVHFNHFMYTGIFSLKSVQLWKSYLLCESIAVYFINKQITPLVRNKLLWSIRFKP